MDVHRARFVPYPTSAIGALAFSRSNDSGFTGPLPALKLAIGRANGNIEIWNPQNGLWVQEAVFLGNDISIDAVAWTQDPDETDGDGHRILGQQRLFSIASSAEVTEWDLATGQPKRMSTGNFSELWCLAAQPRSTTQKDSGEQVQAQELVAGCGDGTLVLLSTADGDLQFKRFLARVSGKNARCICLTYQNRDRVVAGFADGMIRVYNVKTGHLLRTMSLGAGIPGSRKDPLVWQVRCLPNGDIVSADSTGEVKFWDGKAHSLLQRISGHESDCLDLATSSDGRTVFSGSIDGKVAVYRQSNSDGGRKYWSKSSHRRVHGGEVKAMAAFDSKNISVIVSGGGDASPMVIPLREYGKENLRTLPVLPQQPPLASAPQARLLVSWWDTNIYIWRIANYNVESTAEPQRPRKLVARINLDSEDHIQTVSISSNGRLLAASTTSEVRIFQLRKRLGYDSLAIRKLTVPKSMVSTGARLMEFSPDAKWLAIVSNDSEVFIVRVVEDSTRPKHLQVLAKVVELDRQYRKSLDKSAFREYDRRISRLAFASDSSVLVAGDLSGRLDSWVLEGHEDPTALAVDVTKRDSSKGSSSADSDSDLSSDSSDDEDSITVFYGQHWTENPSGHLLPRLPSPPLVFTFRPTNQNAQALVNGNPGVHSTRHNPHAHSHTLPSGQHMLWIMTTKHQMFEYDVLRGRLSDWSRRNPTAVLPNEFTKIRDRVMGAVWDRRERLWLYGSSFVSMLDLGVDFPDSEQSKQQRRPKKEHPRDDAQDENVRKRLKLESGAGGKISSSHKEGIADVVMQYEGDERTEVDLARRQNELERDNAEEDDDVDLYLTRVRSTDDELEVAKQTEGDRTRQRNFWCTFKYRPILGMVPLEDDLSTDDAKPLEVVIVERPLWDVRNENR